MQNTHTTATAKPKVMGTHTTREQSGMQNVCLIDVMKQINKPSIEYRQALLGGGVPNQKNR